MRLICPNCGAQYEVPDDVIPTAGRDVQCSNCGHTWFEQPGASEAAEDDGFFADTPAASDRDTDPDPDPGADPVSDSTEHSEFGAPLSHAADAPDEVPTSQPEDEAPQGEAPQGEAPQDEAPQDEAPQDEPAPDALPDEDVIKQAVATAIRNGTSAGPATEPPPAAAPAEPPRRRGIDPAVAEILREEAERAGAATRAPQALESQPELGIQDAASDQRDEESRRRKARMRGEAAPTTAATMADPGNRRELLPDIEEINSSLRPQADRAATDGSGAPARPRRGFRSGFFTVVLIAAALAAIYAYAPRIEASYPDAKPYLDTYVGHVDDFRLWLDQQMRQIIDKMSPPPDAT